LLGNAGIFKAAVCQACEDLIANSELLNELEAEVGDGDCGSSLADGARGMPWLTVYQLQCPYFIYLL